MKMKRYLHCLWSGLSPLPAAGLAFAGEKGKDSKRYSIKATAVVHFAVFAGLVLIPSLAKETDKPDILFIALDDMNDWTTLFDKSNPIQTPNLKRLAAEKGQSHIFTCFVIVEEEMPLCLSQVEGVSSPGSNVGQGGPRDRSIVL